MHAQEASAWPWQLIQVTSEAGFESYRPAMEQLIQMHESVLLDDATQSGTLQGAGLLDNLADTRPWLWLGFRPDTNTVITISSLTDIVAGRHAFIHGISDPAVRRHPIITHTAQAALEVAFKQLAVLKVKAEFEADLRGPTGFCRRFGFQKEAHFKNDNRINGQLRDVVIYSLFAAHYQPILPPIQPQRSLTPCLLDVNQNPAPLR